jgi:DNA-binding NarL/FixJ family response regulator
MKVAFFDDQQFWRESVVELLGFDGHAVDAFPDSTYIDVEAVTQYDMIIADGRLADNSSGIDELMRFHQLGYVGQLVLYTNLPREKDILLAAKIGVTIVRKKETILDAVRKLFPDRG